MRRTNLWQLLLRGAVFAWAAFFLILGVRGLIDPAVYADTLGVTLGDMVGKSTIRADLSAFFIVSSVFAAIGALPGRGRRVDWLIVPAALFGMAFLGRGLGVVGGASDPEIASSMAAEIASVLLMLIARRALGGRRRGALFSR